MEMSGNSFDLLRSALFPSRTTAIRPAAADCSALVKHPSVNEIEPSATHDVDNIMGTFERMDAMFAEIDKIMLSNSPRTVTAGKCYSATSVMTYVNDGQGLPKVFQASTATYSAPGGIRETRRTLRDSRSGVEKISVGHHLGERSHVVERSRNHRTGQQNEQTDLINMDEDDAAAFKEEWRRKANKLVPTGFADHHQHSHQQGRIDSGNASDAGNNLPNPYRRRLAVTNGVQPTGTTLSGKATKT